MTDTNTTNVTVPINLYPEKLKEIVAAIPEDTKQKVAAAKGPLWKKVLYWCGAVVGVVGVALLIGWILTRKKSPVAAAKQYMEVAAEASKKNDLATKTAVLEAEAKERKEIAALQTVVSNPNVNAKLAEMEAITNAICDEVNK